VASCGRVMLSAVVDGLVAKAPGQAAKREPEGRCGDAVGKILGKASSIAARATPSSSSFATSRPTIFATEARPASNPASRASATARTCESRLRCANEARRDKRGDGKAARVEAQRSSRRLKEWRSPKQALQATGVRENPGRVVPQRIDPHDSSSVGERKSDGQSGDR